LDIVPVGRDSQVILKADWPHPSFGGEFLPSEREITAQGFTARWQTSFFATNMEEALRSCVEEQRCDGFQARALQRRVAGGGALGNRRLAAVGDPG
ncbi:inner membrane CreD family protein, partial [Stenotrophomonas maltophilia]|uniref:inner membrane CreD family protein n=1 Tax=Stenotrophomonas maltophilia TaxID=40324 RepID=UPI001952A9CD